MKYLLRDRMRENRSLLWYCKQFLGGLKSRQTEQMLEGDGVGGLSPDSLTKLYRVQGQLRSGWAKSPTLSVNNGVTRWVKAAKSTVMVTRPKIRVQLRKIEPPKPTSEPITSEDCGLDDIFPKRITGFFEEVVADCPEERPPIVINYKIVNHTDASQTKPAQASSKSSSSIPVFDENIRRKVKWRKASEDVIAQPPKWMERSQAETPAEKPSKPPFALAAALWTALQAKLSALPLEVEESLPPQSEALMPEMLPPSSEQVQQSVLPLEMEDALPLQPEAPAPEMLSPSADMLTARKLPLPSYELPLPEIKEPEPQPVSELARVTGMDLRAMNRPTFENSMVPPESIQKAPVAPEPVETPAAVCSELVQDAIPQPKRQKMYQELAKPSMEPTLRKSDANPELSHIDYMWRNNKILARSISNLADQYFQRAAMEEYMSF